MSTKTTAVPLAALRRIIALDAAGQSDSAIASTLMAEGYTVPRADVSDDTTRTTAQTNRTNTNTSWPSGYNLPTWPGSPGVWNADAVAAVLASTEVAAEIAAPSGWAAANGSPVRLTIA